jgi:PAS domain S-box-containing protein
MNDDKWKLLIVEDDPDQARNVQRLLLKRFEVRADTAADLGRARDALEKKQYDVVVLDYQLPDGSGFDLLTEITSRPVHPAVIIVTGQGDEDIAAEAFRLQASGYVIKDSRLPSMLPEIVSRALSEAALRKAQERLRRSEENGRALLDATPETLMLIDDRANILTINETGAARYGLTPQEMAGTNLYGHVPAELAASRKKYNDHVLQTGEPARFEDNRAGIVFFHVVYPVAAESGKPNRVAIFAQDITERRQAENALARSREELEERVLERTAQLRESNEELRVEIEQRKKIEESLVALTERFQEQATTLDQILSSSPQHFYLFDDRGKFIYASRPAAEMLGHEQSEMESKYWWDLGFPEQPMREVDRQRENVMNTGEPWTGELEFPTPSGKRDFEYILSPIKRSNGTVDTVVATARDVTDAKKVTEELARFNARMQEQAQLIDLTNETVLVRGMDGTIIFWNAGAEEMYGWKREEATGKNIHELLKTEFPVSLDELEDVLMEEGRWEGELTHTARDGRRICIESRQVIRWAEIGMPDAVLEIDYDVTDRKQLQQELESRVAMYEERATLLNLVPKPIIVRDMNSTVTFWSDGARDLFGWTSEDALGKNLHEVLKTEFERPLGEIEFDLLNNGSWEGRLVHVTKDGKRIEGTNHWVLRWDESGAPESIIEIIC